MGVMSSTTSMLGIGILFAEFSLGGTSGGTVSSIGGSVFMSLRVAIDPLAVCQDLSEFLTVDIEILGGTSLTVSVDWRGGTMSEHRKEPLRGNFSMELAK